jgi:hypothetical protein
LHHTHLFNLTKNHHIIFFTSPGNSTSNKLTN